jgi:hypothetical protein
MSKPIGVKIKLFYTFLNKYTYIQGVPELAYQPLTVYFNICSKRDFATINIQTLVVFKLKPF